MSYTDTKFIKLKKDGYSLWMTLNREDFSNAFNEEMIQELVSTLYRADEDNDIRSIIITGAGKHFCAGGDVKKMKNKEGMFSGGPNELRERYKRGIQQIPICMNSLSTPVVAMMNGAAIGAGLDLACMCDIRIASTRAKCGETFTKLGLVPGDGGSYFLQRVVGFAKAMELTLTGKIIDALEAKKIGLVSIVCESEELLAETSKIIESINENAPIANQMSKRAIIHAYNNDLYSNLDLLSSYQGIAQRSSDHFESLEKIIKKEKPTFKHQ